MLLLLCSLPLHPCYHQGRRQRPLQRGHVHGQLAHPPEEGTVRVRATLHYRPLLGTLSSVPHTLAPTRTLTLTLTPSPTLPLARPPHGQPARQPEEGASTLAPTLTLALIKGGACSLREHSSSSYPTPNPDQDARSHIFTGHTLSAQGLVLPRI